MNKTLLIDNFLNATSLIFTKETHPAGTSISFSFPLCMFENDLGYYFAAIAMDQRGQESEVSNVGELFLSTNNEYASTVSERFRVCSHYVQIVSLLGH